MIFVVIGGMVLASSSISSSDVRQARGAVDEVRATALAETGVESTKALLASAAQKMDFLDPLEGVRALFDTGAVDLLGNPILADEVKVATAEPMMADGTARGEYTTTMSLESDTDRQLIVSITSSGYVPAAPQNLGPKERLSAWKSITVEVAVEVGASSVFDNAYFVNNWGWLYGDTITINGNARSNGQMDIGGHKPKITGQPLYDAVAWRGSNAELGNLTSEGGLTSAWDVVDADRATGTGKDGVNIQEFEDQVPMPNLSDLTRYEEAAIAAGSGISIGGVRVADAVTGDGIGELQNLYLVGTASDPIELNGPVVVRGDVLISGYVTGQGVIYSGGNAYIPQDIIYVDGPTSSRPGQNSRTATEQWLSRSFKNDFLGVFAAENVVVGDYTDSSWQRYVGGWLSSSLNASDEDAGEDLLPNTNAGRDGIVGTADDDILEGDGRFSIEVYTLADLAAGLIPPGYSVGDGIPGTGEDIDGDGQYDPTLEVSDFEMDDRLDPLFWAGNVPLAGVANYSDIASMKVNHLDGVFYTNHAFSWVTLDRKPSELNGAMIARNENIIYASSHFDFNYDCRLLAGGEGLLLDDCLPLVLQPMRSLSWRRNTEDPHRAIVTP